MFLSHTGWTMVTPTIFAAMAVGAKNGHTIHTSTCTWISDSNLPTHQVIIYVCSLKGWRRIIVSSICGCHASFCVSMKGNGSVISLLLKNILKDGMFPWNIFTQTGNILEDKCELSLNTITLKTKSWSKWVKRLVATGQYVSVGNIGHNSSSD